MEQDEKRTNETCEISTLHTCTSRYRFWEKRPQWFIGYPIIGRCFLLSTCRTAKKRDIVNAGNKTGRKQSSSSNNLNMYIGSVRFCGRWWQVLRRCFSQRMQCITCGIIENILCLNGCTSVSERMDADLTWRISAWLVWNLDNDRNSFVVIKQRSRFSGETKSSAILMHEWKFFT